MDSEYDWIKSESFRRAAEMGDLEEVRSLAPDPSVDLNLHGKGVPAFYGACVNGHSDIVRFFLDFEDADRSFSCNFIYHGHTPLEAACYEGHEEVIKMLLADERIKIFSKDPAMFSPLTTAAEEGRLNIVKLILASEKQPYLNSFDEVVLNHNGVLKPSLSNLTEVPNGKEIAQLIDSFKKNPEKTRVELKIELGQSEALAGSLFALIVFLSDEYLKAPDS